MADPLKAAGRRKPLSNIDQISDAEFRHRAARLCVTPGELREMVEEAGGWPDRLAEAGYQPRDQAVFARS